MPPLLLSSPCAGKQQRPSRLLLELLQALPAAGRHPAALPFVLRTLQQLLTPGVPWLPRLRAAVASGPAASQRRAPRLQPECSAPPPPPRFSLPTPISCRRPRGAAGGGTAPAVAAVAGQRRARVRPAARRRHRCAGPAVLSPPCAFRLPCSSLLASLLLRLGSCTLGYNCFVAVDALRIAHSACRLRGPRAAAGRGAACGARRVPARHLHRRPGQGGGAGGAAAGERGRGWAECAVRCVPKTPKVVVGRRPGRSSGPVMATRSAPSRPASCLPPPPPPHPPPPFFPLSRLQECVGDESPAVAAVGLDCIALLCEADVLEFYGAWRVVHRRLPRLPDHPGAGAAWLRLLGGGALDAAVQPEAAAAIVDALWLAAAHEAPQVGGPAWVDGRKHGGAHGSGDSRCWTLAGRRARPCLAPCEPLPSHLHPPPPPRRCGARRTPRWRPSGVCVFLSVSVWCTHHIATCFSRCALRPDAVCVRLLRRRPSRPACDPST